jgi:hypothetical protein
MRKGNRRPAYPKKKAAQAPTGKTIRWKRPPYKKGWAREQISYIKAKPGYDRDELLARERGARFALEQDLLSQLAHLRQQKYRQPVKKTTIRWIRKK